MDSRDGPRRQGSETSWIATRKLLARLLVVMSCAALHSGCGGEHEEPGSERVPPESVTLLDLDGGTVYPFRHPDRHPEERFTVFLFTRTDCPISNRYAPEVRRLHERFEPLGVEFVLVYLDPAQSAAAIREHVTSFEYRCRPLRDPRHELVRLAGATVTPEAALYERNGTLLYLGRIDDRFTDFGKARQQASSRDLENALVAVTTNARVPVSRTPAVGCFISDLLAKKTEDGSR